MAIKRLRMWGKLTKHQWLTSTAHILVGVVIALLSLNKTGALSGFSQPLGAVLLFVGFILYELCQWISKNDPPSEEIGEMLLGFAVAVCVGIHGI
jgi:hypothetical protein